MLQELRAFWDSFRAGLLDSLPNGRDLARFLTQIIKVIVIGALTLWVARRIKALAARVLGRARVAPNVLALVGNGVFVLSTIFGLSWLLAALGATWTAVLASLSVVTVAIGLSLQDVLKNFVAGVYILLEQPFKIGDRVEIKGIGGEVEGVDIRTTILRTDEGVQVLVPNNVVFTEIVTNRSAYDTRHVALQIAETKVDFSALSRLIDESLEPFEAIVRTPARRVTIQKVDDGLATIGLDYWQRGDGAPLPEVIGRLQEHFPDAAITITKADGLKVGAA